MAEYRIHWQHVSADKKVSYEVMMLIKLASLGNEDTVCRLCGTLLNALSWVRGSRLDSIRVGLTNLKQPPARADSRVTIEATGLKVCRLPTLCLY